MLAKTCLLFKVIAHTANTNNFAFKIIRYTVRSLKKPNISNLNPKSSTPMHDENLVQKIQHKALSIEDMKREEMKLFQLNLEQLSKKNESIDTLLCLHNQLKNKNQKPQFIHKYDNFILHQIIEKFSALTEKDLFQLLQKFEKYSVTQNYYQRIFIYVIFLVQKNGEIKAYEQEFLFRFIQKISQIIKFKHFEIQIKNKFFSFIQHILVTNGKSKQKQEGENKLNKFIKILKNNDFFDENDVLVYESLKYQVKNYKNLKKTSPIKMIKHANKNILKKSNEPEPSLEVANDGEKKSKIIDFSMKKFQKRLK